MMPSPNDEVRIVRFYAKSGRRRTLKHRVKFSEAIRRLASHEGMSHTARKPVNIKRTKRLGRWFDTYEPLKGKEG